MISFIPPVKPQLAEKAWTLPTGHPHLREKNPSAPLFQMTRRPLLLLASPALGTTHGRAKMKRQRAVINMLEVLSRVTDNLAMLGSHPDLLAPVTARGGKRAAHRAQAPGRILNWKMAEA